MNKAVSRNLFVVGNATQLLIAEEAKANYIKDNTASNDVLIIAQDVRVIKQVRLVLDINKWNSIFWAKSYSLPAENIIRSFKAFRKLLDYKTKNNIIKRCEVFLNTYGSFDRLFIGNLFLPVYNEIVAAAQCSNITIFDEGARTIALFEKLHNNDKQFTLSQIIAEKEIDFFTCYYNYSKALSYKIVPNKMIYINSIFNSERPASNEVWFLGMPIYSKNGLISKKEYLELIKKISSTYCNKKFIYIAHRKESIKELKGVSDFAEVRKSTLPVELLILNNNTYPFIVCSFYSSALVFINEAFSSFIKVEAFRLNAVTIEYAELLNNLYTFFENSGITVRNTTKLES